MLSEGTGRMPCALFAGSVWDGQAVKTESRLMATVGRGGDVAVGNDCACECGTLFA